VKLQKAAKRLLFTYLDKVDVEKKKRESLKLENFSCGLISVKIAKLLKIGA